MNDRAADPFCPINLCLPSFESEPGLDAVKHRLHRARDFLETLPVGQTCVQLAYDPVLQREIASFLLEDPRRAAEAALLIFDANSEIEVVAGMTEEDAGRTVFSQACVDRTTRLLGICAESVPTAGAALRAFADLLSELAGANAEDAREILASPERAARLREAWPGDNR